MLDAAAARARLLASFGPDHPPMVVFTCELTPRGTHWVLTANTEAYACTGDVGQALVGANAWLVDRVTGAVEAFSTTRFALDALEDRHDAAEAGARVWVVRPEPDADTAAIVRLRQLLGVPPAHAQALMRSGPWFRGPRRVALDTQAQLRALGLSVELALVDDPGVAVELLRLRLDLPDALLDALRLDVGPDAS